MNCYNRSGAKITLREWASLLVNERYRQVAETTLEDGTWISTIWFGLDYFHRRPPLIFETMVFSQKGPPVSMADIMSGAAEHLKGQECWRWPTEAAALAGHDQVVAKITEALERLKAALSEIENEQ